ncbi:hypothetical protein KFU94_70710 [Chloroflexi bacterium TSY]|nr:hypothetical protein [Chloroflexi bacterium TSY]
MMKSVTNRERERLQTVVDEYQGRGYEVILQPGPDQLPEFLRDYQPTLIARQDEETIVIEVKSRRSLSQSPWIRDMAHLLQEKEGSVDPNFRF